MPERHAVIVDDDQDFRALVERSLGASGFKVDLVSDNANGLKRIARIRPEIVFIAVDLPERSGFTVCTRTKSLVKGARVVLATSTIPWREMEMHHKLKVHADLYLDKRRLDEAEFRRQVEGLVRSVAGMETAGSASTAGAGREPSDPAGEDMPSGRVSMEDEAAAEGDVDLGHLLADLSPGAAGWASDSVDVAALEEKIQRLERELAEARSYSQSSPFSRDFFALRDRLNEGEQEIVRLKKEVTGRGQRIALLEEKERELAAALGEKATLERDLKDLRGRLAAAATEAEKNQRDAIQAAEQKHQGALAALETRLQAEKGRAVDAVRVEAEKKLA